MGISQTTCHVWRMKTRIGFLSRDDDRQKIES